MKIPNCLKRDIFLAKLITFLMRKASQNSQVYVTLLAWFTAKSINFSINSTILFSINIKSIVEFILKLIGFNLVEMLNVAIP